MDLLVIGGGTRTISGTKVLINTGTVPSLPPIDGLAGANVQTSESILRLQELIVELSDGSSVSAQVVLVELGREPVAAGLGLEKPGVELTPRGFVAVDQHLRITADGVWAAGDVAGSPQFTHAS
ncbi:FAD-dependent oxidoreductase [Pseudarthrobacter sp. Y6]|uniref:FAD-dependent oxidoreductase n=1 Tax=Pseudarthrobacter sp. Y6 TaxID=3418422 RepID=UPI003CFA7281